MEQTVLQGMIDRVIEIARCYGMEMDVQEFQGKHP